MLIEIQYYGCILVILRSYDSLHDVSRETGIV